MGKTFGIKKSLFTHYYKLDWSMDYGETREKVYLAIKGKIEPRPMLYLEVRRGSQLWHEAGGKDKIEKISRKEFMKNATGRNVAKFYSSLPEYNNLLNYSPKIWKEMSKYNYPYDNYGKSYNQAIKKNNKKSVMNELKELKLFSKSKSNERLKNEKCKER